MSLFCERLKELKEFSRKTQIEIAESLNLTPQALSYYFNGREPGYDILIKIADYFGVSLDYLLGRESNIEMNNNSLDFLLEKGLNIALWVRIKDENLNFDCNLPIYQFDLEHEIELYDPLIERSKSISGRIYLDFVNTDKIDKTKLKDVNTEKEDVNIVIQNEQLKNIFNFMKKYGFIGKLPSLEHYIGVQRRRTLIEIVSENNFSFFNDLIFFTKEHLGLLSQISKSLRSPHLVMGYDSYNYTRFRTLQDNGKILGYFELLTNVKNDMNDLIKTLSSLPNLKYLEQTNYFLSDIQPIFIEKDGKLYQTIGYKSLLGLMYLELLLDVKNNIIPKLCPKCGCYYVETCKNCNPPDTEKEV